MITEPIVFILGAGASMPYGYPSGEGLSNEIINSLEYPTNPYFFRLKEMGFTDAEIFDFRNSFKRSNKSSIDAFLEHRNNFINIGKSIIAIILMKLEIEDKLLNIENGNWFRYLYNQMNATIDEFKFNKISFITFNYDRSLEQLFFMSIQNSYGLSNEECINIISNIPIIHIYGTLGPLDWQDKVGRKYIHVFSADEIKKAAKEIKIIHEKIDIENDPQIITARKLIKKASSIHFLGFGYNKNNIRRLNLHEATQVMGGTVKGLGDAEITTAKKLLNRGGGQPFDDCDCLAYLKKRIVFE